MKYEIVEILGSFRVWRVTPYGAEVVKTFKTRKGAENWVKSHS
jgi:hypothetical protein